MQGNVAKILWLAEEKTGFKESLSSHEECHLHTIHGYEWSEGDSRNSIRFLDVLPQ